MKLTENAPFQFPCYYRAMTNENERILVVEGDPEVSDLIASQALQPLGYQVRVVDTASEAIKQAMLFSPHLVLTSLDLPDLSGKDLIVALSSQGLKMPIILIAEEGNEGDIIQSFRLGATDYLQSPVREAELVSVVERALKQTRAPREREQLARQVKEKNDELKQRLRELTTIFAIGKAVTSITNQSTLFDRIIEGAVYVTNADRGWLLIREAGGKAFILRAYRHLPGNLADKLNQPWDDGISSLVALSGESLNIHGDPIKRFPIARLGRSALVIPVKVHQETIGLLIVMRKENVPFTSSDQTMLEAVADYASISLANARLFRELEERARSLQKAMDNAKKNEQSKDELIHEISDELRRPLVAAKGYVDLLIDGEMGSLGKEQAEALAITEDNLKRLLEVIESMGAVNRDVPSNNLAPTNLNELIRDRIGRHQHIAQQTGLALLAELPTNPVMAHADAKQLRQVLDGLITNAVKFSPQGGQITIRVQQREDKLPQLTISDTGVGIDENDIPHIFDQNPPKLKSSSTSLRGLGLRLAFVKDIIAAHGGQIWVESAPGQGSTFHFTLLPAE